MDTSSYTELVQAVEGVLPHLLTSYDGLPPEPAVHMPTGAGLRMAADRIEKRDAAIHRLRRALTAVKEEG